jgi:DNA-directed RNA polymerase specialized sigma24 family protein
MAFSTSRAKLCKLAHNAVNCQKTNKGESMVHTYRHRATLPAVDAVATISSRKRMERERGIGTDEALAIAAYRRYAWERQSGRDAPACRYSGRMGRPSATPTTAVYDARIVRKIDFERCLKTIGEYFASILKLYYVDGESQAVVAASAGRSVRSINDDLPKARKALADALDAVQML